MSKLDMIKEKLNLNKKKVVGASVGVAVVALMAGSLAIYEEYRENKIEQKIYAQMRNDINSGKFTVESSENVLNTENNSNVQGNGSNSVSAENNTQSNEIKTISRTEALNIALNDLNISENDAKHVEISLDYDYYKRSNQRKYIYEIEFIYDWIEYSYDIDAVTGQIVGMEMDKDVF